MTLRKRGMDKAKVSPVDLAKHAVNDNWYLVYAVNENGAISRGVMFLTIFLIMLWVQLIRR